MSSSPLQEHLPKTTQPRPSSQNGEWMNRPQEIPMDHCNCPPGLEYLTKIDQLLVQQKVEGLEDSRTVIYKQHYSFRIVHLLREEGRLKTENGCTLHVLVLTGFETKNKFTIKNSLGQKVYYAKEDSDCLTRNCCGPLRPFDMKILDNYKNEVIHLYRPLACGACCFPCCLQSMEVSSPPGNIVGRVDQEWSIFLPKYAVKNASGETVLRIEGPWFKMSCCGDVEFKITSADGSVQLGKISKQWSGVFKEMFTDADNFGITFPMDLDVRMKAVLLGACFLIDAMYFEI